MWVGLGVWCGGCGGGDVKKVYFRCGSDWEWGVVLSVLFDLREHICANRKFISTVNAFRKIRITF